MFGRLAATLTELELVRCVRDPHQLSNLAALFPHAPLHPTHGDHFHFHFHFFFDLVSFLLLF
jgi:hypothetical protein